MKPWASEEGKKDSYGVFHWTRPQSRRPKLKCVKRYLVPVESQEKLEAAMKTGGYYHIMVPSVNVGVTAGNERGEFCGEHDHIEC
jgi:hypothetical protein